MELYSYQIAPVNVISDWLKSRNFAILNADMGAGKTIMGSFIAKRLQDDGYIDSVSVLSPKIVVSAWKRVLAEVGCKTKFVYNPELLRYGSVPEILEKMSKTTFIWRGIGDRDLVIIDEIHTYGGLETQVAKMLLSLQDTRCKILACTGTLGQTPLRMRIILHLAGMVNWSLFYHWALRNGCFRDQFTQGAPWRFIGGKKGMQIIQNIHNYMQSNKIAYRLRTQDIPEFPDCEYQVDLYDAEPEMLKKMQEAWAALRDEIKSPEMSAKNELVYLLRCRQRIQSVKIPLLHELTQECLDEGYSVVVFFDFKEPMYQFAEGLKPLGVSLVHGDQSQKERDMNVEKFQKNENRVIAMITSAGGVGVSLGDETGEYPRVALMNIPIDGITAIQAAERIHRANSKSKAIVRFVLVAGDETEQKLYNLIKSKLKNLASLQGDDINNIMLK